MTELALWVNPCGIRVKRRIIRLDVTSETPCHHSGPMTDYAPIAGFSYFTCSTRLMELLMPVEAAILDYQKPLF